MVTVPQLGVVKDHHRVVPGCIPQGEVWHTCAGHQAGHHHLTVSRPNTSAVTGVRVHALYHVIRVRKASVDETNVMPPVKRATPTLPLRPSFYLFSAALSVEIACKRILTHEADLSGPDLYMRV